ncbi:hypothetical protein [Sphingosinicella sp.]|uniref:hypothetical protein n=1 Tax=Sphingosinicella sp. TaxID=1917971 RepID=UPI004037E235
MSKSDTRIRTISRQEFRQFVELRVQPPLQSIALKFWELVAHEAPELALGMRGGTEKYIPVPVWRLDRDVMVLSPSAAALTISFANGALFDDPEDRLGGAGKVSRTLKLRSASDLEGPSIVSFLRQAVQHR